MAPPSIFGTLPERSIPQGANHFSKWEVCTFLPYITISRCQRLSDNSSAHTPPQKSSSAHTKSKACFYFALSAYNLLFLQKIISIVTTPLKMPKNGQKQ
jgi:hypothetical protein